MVCAFNFGMWAVFSIEKLFVTITLPVHCKFTFYDNRRTYVLVVDVINNTDLKRLLNIRISDLM
jgi:hypothetical protein